MVKINITNLRQPYLVIDFDVHFLGFELQEGMRSPLFEGP